MLLSILTLAVVLGWAVYQIVQAGRESGDE